MNERIKELYKQAGYTPLPGFDFANDLQEVFLKKFAELIVEECVGLCMNVNGDLPRTEPLVAASIRKYFGVKE